MTTPRIQQIVVVLAVAAAGLLALAYYRERGEMRKMQEENELLRAKVEQRAAREAGMKAVADLHRTAKVTVEDMESDAGQPEQQPATPPVASTASMEPELVLTPTGLAAEPRSDGLDLVDSSAVEMPSGGIKTTMRFMPTISEPVGIVAVVVRLPRDADAQIRDLVINGSMKYADIAKRVSEDGKFAILQINADVVEDLQVELDVSAPAVADVRGTAGIGPYDLEIGYGTVNVVKKE